MNSRRVYSATFENISQGTAAASIMELQVPANSIIKVLRAWLSPAIGTPVDEVVAISVYSNDVAGASGTAITEQGLTPAAQADPTNCTAVYKPTIGATPFFLYRDGYHLQNGWLWVPIPEEMPILIGGNSDPGDVLGLELAIASTNTFSISGGFIWEEVSAA